MPQICVSKILKTWHR